MSVPEYKLVTSCNVLVQVVGAKNVPLREEFTNFDIFDSLNRANARVMDRNTTIASNNENQTSIPMNSVITANLLNYSKISEKSRANSFIEIKFQEYTVATVTLEGGTPIWKQLLSIPFHPPGNDFNPSNLAQVDEDVTFTLFDEVLYDDYIDGTTGNTVIALYIAHLYHLTVFIGGRGFLEGEETRRVEKRYLGDFTIPFMTIYKNHGRVDGMFRLNVPIFNLGYTNRSTLAMNQSNALNFHYIHSTSNSSIDYSNYLVYMLGLVTCQCFGQGNRPATTASINDNAVDRVVASTGRDVSHIDRPSDENINTANDLIDSSSSAIVTTAITSNVLSEFSYYLTDDSVTFIKLMITLDPLLFDPTLLSNVDPTSSEAYSESLGDTQAVHGSIANTRPSDSNLVNVLPQDQFLLAYSQIWLDKLNNKVKNSSTRMEARKFRVMVLNSEGYNVFLPRFLTPQSPPSGFSSRRACLHLVSILPFLSDTLLFNANPNQPVDGNSVLTYGNRGNTSNKTDINININIWCSCKQLWDIGAGDEEEHGVLLYNYLYYLTHYANNSLNTKTHEVTSSGNSVSIAFPSPEQLSNESLFLVLGKGIPEGETVYILMKVYSNSNTVNSPHNQHNSQQYSSRNYLLINPNTGEIYSAMDANCPLKEVYSLITPYNIWANIQPSVHPNLLTYNIQDKSCWTSFFSVKCPYPMNGLQTIQPEITYMPTRLTYCIDIEKELKDNIKQCFATWRSKRIR